GGVVTGGVVAGGVVAGGVVAGGVAAGAVPAGAGFVVVRAPLVDVRAASWGWDVDGAADVAGSVVAGAAGTAAGVAGGRNWPPNASVAVFVGSGPAVARAMPRPEPEMITAVRIRNAARRRGSSRRWERIIR